MQVRTFSGPTANSVQAQIKAEMGPDAVILSSRSRKENGRTVFEITAGLERGAHPEKGVSATVSGPVEADTAQAPPGWDEWHRDWNQIKEHLLALMKPGIQLEILSPRQRLAVEYLMREGMDDQTLLRLYRAMAGKPDLSVLEVLTELVPVRPWGLEQWPQEIQVLAGPFGAGKTTAALRMALALRMEDSTLPILFINADCERGHGRLLLRHYADLSGMEYAEASSADGCINELRRWSAENGSHSRVIVDLPGLGRDTTLADQLARLGLTGSGIGLHLVMSPLMSGAQQTEFLRRYNCDGLRPTPGLIWTKLDEAGAYGAVVNTGAATGIAASALSFGPGLTDTLVPAYNGHLWRIVFKHQFPQSAGGFA